MLGRLIPEFGKIVAMMQFNMYHHYTVDEHLLRCIGVLSEIERGEGEKLHPLSHTLMPGLKKQREVLYVALLLHDIAKGRPEDHSLAGARIARRICPHMGLSPADTETVAWLVENHLLMSMTAQTRDLNDRKTIDDFAAVVQSVERLKLLLVLTVCDIRGVGPGRLERLEGPAAAHALLRDRAAADRRLLGSVARRSAPPPRASGSPRRWPTGRRSRARALCRPALRQLPAGGRPRRPAAPCRIHPRGRRRRQARSPPWSRPHQFEAVTEITVLAQDHPRLLSVIAGACAAAGGNIVDAQIFTTTDGRALDTILISREFDRDEDERRRAERVGRLIEDVLSGKSWLPEMIEKRTKPKRGAKAFRIEPRADIGNTLSNRFSVIEVSGLDRPGLLSEITGALSDLSLDIASAHITTFGEKVIDTFYVTDLTGQKIENPTRTAAIRARLIAILEGAGRRARPRAAAAAMPQRPCGRARHARDCRSTVAAVA